MKFVIFKFKITPLAKPRMTRSDRWKKRPTVMRYWGYKSQLKAMAKLYGYIPHPDDVVFFGLPMPRSWSKKKRTDSHFEFHKSKPDTDNLQKGLWDALLEDDSGLYRINSTKIWVDSEIGCIVILQKTKGENKTC